MNFDFEADIRSCKQNFESLFFINGCINETVFSDDVDPCFDKIDIRHLGMDVCWNLVCLLFSAYRHMKNVIFNLLEYKLRLFPWKTNMDDLREILQMKGK